MRDFMFSFRVLSPLWAVLAVLLAFSGWAWSLPLANFALWACSFLFFALGFLTCTSMDERRKWRKRQRRQARKRRSLIMDSDRVYRARVENLVRAVRAHGQPMEQGPVFVQRKGYC